MLAVVIVKDELEPKQAPSLVNIAAVAAPSADFSSYQVATSMPIGPPRLPPHPCPSYYHPAVPGRPRTRHAEE